ncbi:MAG: hypothetical protein U9P44_01725 [archaeon]|nr:hypothetical protein [archaeon]
MSFEIKNNITNHEYDRIRAALTDSQEIRICEKSELSPSFLTLTNILARPAESEKYQIYSACLFDGANESESGPNISIPDVFSLLKEKLRKRYAITDKDTDTIKDADTIEAFHIRDTESKEHLPEFGGYDLYAYPDSLMILVCSSGNPIRKDTLEEGIHHYFDVLEHVINSVYNITKKDIYSQLKPSLQIPYKGNMTENWFNGSESLFA